MSDSEFKIIKKQTSRTIKSLSNYTYTALNFNIKKQKAFKLFDLKFTDLFDVSKNIAPSEQPIFEENESVKIYFASNSKNIELHNINLELAAKLNSINFNSISEKEFKNILNSYIRG